MLITVVSLASASEAPPIALTVAADHRVSGLLQQRDQRRVGGLGRARPAAAARHSAARPHPPCPHPIRRTGPAPPTGRRWPVPADGMLPVCGVAAVCTA